MAAMDRLPRPVVYEEPKWNKIGQVDILIERLSIVLIFK